MFVNEYEPTIFGMSMQSKGCETRGRCSYNPNFVYEQAIFRNDICLFRRSNVAKNVAISAEYSCEWNLAIPKSNLNAIKDFLNCIRLSPTQWVT